MHRAGRISTLSAAPALALAMILAPAWLGGCAAGSQTTSPAGRSTAMDFRLSSSAFDEGGEIPVRHTCDGEDVPLPFSWSGTPEGTAELALVVDDPDARGFVHWLVVGIPAEASEIGEAGLPAGAREGRTDFGRTGYGGPCPPSGSHRYTATLYALSAPLDLTANPTADEVRSAASGKILAEARLNGRYARR
jgi:hypothetical protein